MSYVVYVIAADGRVERTTQPKMPSLEQLQAAVGGYIETVPYFTKLLGHKRGTAYCNEDGLALRLPHNPRASAEWAENYKHATGLLGPVVIYFKEIVK